ncbi:MAG TPA: pitrilysin family protein [Candidatus Xenobia bacterium]|jgi:zinc protease
MLKPMSEPAPGGVARQALSEGVERHRLPDGTTLLVREQHATPLVAVCLLVRGGAWQETATTGGRTHLLQRCLLKGTTRRSGADLAFELESHGISLSPFTGKDMSGISVGLLSRHLEVGLQLLAEVMWSPALDQAAVEQEKRNIVQELERKQDDPLGWSLELCERSMFPGHSYSVPLTGLPETVADTPSAALPAWHRSLYGRPEDTIVCVVGDVPVDRVRELWPPWGLPSVGRAAAPAVPQFQGVSIRQSKPRHQAAVCLGFPAPAVTAADHAAFDVLNHLLSGMGSRLFVEVRDRQGLAYVVNSGYEARLAGGTFRCYLATSPEQEAAAQAALQHELVRLQEEPPPADEVARAVQYIRGLHAIGLQRNSAQAARLAWYELAGLGYEAVDRHVEALGEVTPDDIQRSARTWLGGPGTVAIVSPVDTPQPATR